MKFLKIIFVLIVFLSALCFPAFALTNYTVNHLGGADYTDLTACITAINAGADTDYVVTFTDVGAYTYVLSPGEQTIPPPPPAPPRPGVNVTFTHATAGIVTIDGRLNVANDGGTFTASKIGFKNSLTSSGSEWCQVHGYGMMSFTNCAFGLSLDNGVVVWGDSLFDTCTFNGATNSAIMAGALPGTTTGGNGQANNCTWTNVGRAVGTWANVPAAQTGKFVVNGGSATGSPTKTCAFLCSGFNLEANNFTSTGFRIGACTDWQEGTGTAVFNNCNFVDSYDRTVSAYADLGGRLGSGTLDMTFNNCNINVNVLATGVDCVVLDGRGISQNITLTFNGCKISCPSLLGSCVVSYAGGTINLNNTVVDGGENSMLCNSTDIALQTALNANHCVFVNASEDPEDPGSGQVLGTGNFAATSVKVQNCIIDASNVHGMNADDPLITAVIEYNLVNSSGTTDGSPFFTGDPLFVNAGAGDFHIQDGSAAANKGVITTLLVDVDGDTRPLGGASPDIGIDEIAETPPTHVGVNWSIYN